MVTMVDPPGGWAYGFPQPLQGDYEKQLRDAGYPESDIPIALLHSWYHTAPDGPDSSWPAMHIAVDKAQPGGDHTSYIEYYYDRSTRKIVIERMKTVEPYTGTASDGDDGA
jgi:hypothetical protein